MHALLQIEGRVLAGDQAEQGRGGHELRVRRRAMIQDRMALGQAAHLLVLQQQRLGVDICLAP